MISITKAFNIIYMSFYSKELYKMVAKHWKGLALSYILSFSTIMFIVFCSLTAYSYYNITHKLEDLAKFQGTPNSLAEKFIYNFPNIKIDAKGEASGPDKTLIIPFLKGGAGKQSASVVVDLNSNKQVEEIPSDILPLVQFTKHYVYMLTDTTKTKYNYISIPYSRLLQFKPESSDKNTLNGRDLVSILLDSIFTIKTLLLNKYTLLFTVLVAVFAIIFISHLITAIIIALLMYCIAHICKYFSKTRQFMTDLREIFRVSAVSVTPLLIISKVNSAIFVNFLDNALYNYFIIIIFFVTLTFYPAYGFIVNSQHKRKK